MKKALLLFVVVAVVGVLINSVNSMGVMSERYFGIADSNSIRSLKAGDVVGFADNYETFAWLGIPFAKAPTGDLRWKSPRPVEKWSDVQQALSFKSACAQIGGPLANVDKSQWDKAAGSEDCLYLNVWAPRQAEKLPVMVWIHGGGNTIGTAATYNGEHLAGSQQVIVVTLNYRLGMFGWFSHPSLRSEGESALDASGNYGTLDLIAGLRWVQDNIAALGGDPDNVTIFGESAGGLDTYSLLASKQAAGLFHKAIAQSGSLRTVPRSWMENLRSEAVRGGNNSASELLVKRLLKKAELVDRAAAIEQLNSWSSDQTKDYLYALTPADFFEVVGKHNMGMYLAPTLLRDGVVLPKQPVLERMKAGDYNQVPVMLGSNRDESKLFLSQDPDLTDSLFGVIPRVNDWKQYHRVNAYHSQHWKAMAVDEPATVMSANHDVFAYRFDWDEEADTWLIDLSALIGAAHGLEVAFVFGDFDGGMPIAQLFPEASFPARDKLSAAMMSYWAQFAYSGNPGRGRQGDLPQWQAWSPKDGYTSLLLDTENDAGIKMLNSVTLPTDIKARLLSDSELSSQHLKCKIYAQLFLMSFQESHLWDEQEYQSFDDGSCSQYSAYDFTVL